MLVDSCEMHPGMKNHQIWVGQFFSIWLTAGYNQFWYSEVNNTFAS